jgi:hypothetical protein
VIINRNSVTTFGTQFIVLMSKNRIISDKRSDAFELPSAANELDDDALLAAVNDALAIVSARHEMLRASVDPRGMLLLLLLLLLLPCSCGLVFIYPPKGIRLADDAKLTARSVPFSDERDFQTRMRALARVRMLLLLLLLLLFVPVWFNN